MTKEYRNYIKIAKTGHYDLFPSNWLEETLKENNKLPRYSIANKNVKKVFEKLSKHKNLDRKKTLLLSLPEIERKEFIRSFYALVENTTFEGNHTLQ